VLAAFPRPNGLETASPDLSGVDDGLVCNLSHSYLLFSDAARSELIVSQENHSSSDSRRWKAAIQTNI